MRSALQVDLTHETVRLPLFKAHVKGQTAWYVITEASDPGIAADLNVNHAAKLTNLPVGCDTCVQSAAIEAPTPEQNRFGTAVIDRPGAPDFSPTRILQPGPTGFPPAKAEPGAVGDDSYSPFIRLAGSPVVYNAPIVATGDGPFDVVHHTNTADRVLGIHIAPPAAPGKFNQSWVDLLLVKGFDAGQPILYLSTESNDRRPPPWSAPHSYPPCRRSPTTAATTRLARPASGSSHSSTGRPAPTTRRRKASPI